MNSSFDCFMCEGVCVIKLFTQKSAKCYKTDREAWLECSVHWIYCIFFTIYTKAKNKEKEGSALQVHQN